MNEREGGDGEGRDVLVEVVGRHHAEQVHRPLVPRELLLLHVPKSVTRDKQRPS